MKTINFDRGEIVKFDSLYFEINLFKGDKKVYSSLIDLSEFMKIANKHKNIQVKAF